MADLQHPCQDDRPGGVFVCTGSASDFKASASVTMPALSLAPLRGVTVSEFRRLHAQRFGGLDSALAPFIPLVAGDRVQPKLLKDILPENNGGVRTVPQVIGKDPEQLRAMGRAIADLGYAELNLNCGCPWKFVAKKGRGSGLPEDEDAFRRMLDAGCEAMPGGFSIKIRLGMKDKDTLAKRAALIASYPLNEIIVHPRTAVQMYEGEVDLEAFAAVLPLLPMPVVYNGDIRTVNDYATVTARFPSLAGVMIGRGVVADPMLPERIRAWEATGCGTVQTLPRNPERVAAFIGELYWLYRRTLSGPSPVLGRMKELWGYAYVAFEAGADMLRAVQRSRTFEDYADAVRPISDAHR